LITNTVKTGKYSYLKRKSYWLQTFERYRLMVLKIMDFQKSIMSLSVTSPS